VVLWCWGWTAEGERWLRWMRLVGRLWKGLGVGQQRAIGNICCSIDESATYWPLGSLKAAFQGNQNCP
jgi:hypothetical protein